MTSTSKPAVLYVITRLAVGGAPQSALTAIRGLLHLGYDVTLVTGLPAPNEGNLISVAKETGVRLIVMPHLVREPHPIRDFCAFWQLWRLMRRERFDLVHTHISKAGILGRLAAYLAGVRAIVHTYHGDVLEGYFSSLKSWIFLKAERLAGRVTDRFVCVSQPLRERLQPYQLGVSDRFRVIDNGIDVSMLVKTRRRREENCRVGTMAMFYPIKRLDLFIDMASRLRQRRRDIACVIAGDGMAADRLYRQNKSLGEPVDFVGICDDPQAFFSGLDIFVLCSDFEGAGMSVMEAMAAGIPVVATRVGGMQNIVQDGETGLLILPSDSNALEAAVLQLLENAELRQQMGEKARDYAQSHFSSDRMVMQLDALYGELLP